MSDVFFTAIRPIMAESPVLCGVASGESGRTPVINTTSYEQAYPLEVTAESRVRILFIDILEVSNAGVQMVLFDPFVVFYGGNQLCRLDLILRGIQPEDFIVFEPLECLVSMPYFTLSCSPAWISELPLKGEQEGEWSVKEAVCGFTECSVADCESTFISEAATLSALGFAVSSSTLLTSGAVKNPFADTNAYAQTISEFLSSVTPHGGVTCLYCDVCGRSVNEVGAKGKIYGNETTVARCVSRVSCEAYLELEIEVV